MKKPASKKTLNRFLFFYCLLWGILPAIFLHSIFPDTAQNISWGHVFLLGTDRHPPLGVWVIQLLNFFLHNNEWAAYLSGSICLAISLWLTYKIGCLFLSEETAVAATLLSSLLYFYVANYVLQYDQGTIMFPFWIGSIYFFSKALKKNNYADWIFLGVMAALAMQAKYESALIIFLEIVYLFFHFDKKYYRGLLLSFFVFIALLLPHLFWLVQNHFLLLQFPMHRAYDGNSTGFIARHVINPLSFFIVQPFNLTLSVLLFFVALHKKWLVVTNEKKSDSFLIYFAISPLLLVCLLSLVTGAEILAEWGSPLLLLTMLGLFYYKKIKILSLEKIFYLCAFFQLLIAIIYFSDSYFVSDISRLNYPGNALATQVKNFWKLSGYEEKKPAFIGGDDYPSYYLTAYLNKTTPLLVQNSLYYSPWIKKDRFYNHVGILAYKGCESSHNKNILARFQILKEQCFHIPAANKFKLTQVIYHIYIVTPKNDAKATQLLLSKSSEI